MSIVIPFDWLPVSGSIVSKRKGLFQHFALISDSRAGGMVWVIETSPEFGVIERPYWEFCGNHPIQQHGFPGGLHRREVMERARSLVGQPYDAINNNCEHFVRWCHGLERESPQLKRFVALGAVAIGAWLLASAA